MSRLFWITIVFFLFLIALVGVVLQVNKGDFGGCGKFIDVSSNQSVGCGVTRFRDLTFDGRTYENYIGVGEVAGLKYDDGKMLIEMMMPWGEKFGYKLEIELDKRPDGKIVLFNNFSPRTTP